MNIVKNKEFILTEETIQLIIQELEQMHYLYCEHNNEGEIFNISTEDLTLNQAYQGDRKNINTNIIIQIESYLKEMLNSQTLLTETSVGAYIFSLDNFKGVTMTIVAEKG